VVGWRIGAVAAAAFLCAAIDGTPAQSAQSIARQRDGALMIAGRALRCGTSRNVLDARLPNLGLAAPGVLVINPRALDRWSGTVQLFVYHHECGHHHIGGDELKADCWAVNEGVRQGWLTREGLGQVCRSFGGGPATSTHPSGARRCASLDRCFASAEAAVAKERAAATTIEAQATPPPAAPQLVQEPSLKRSGMLPGQDPK
jgi:hypothetical protein